MQNSLSVLWHGFCLLLGLPVSWLMVIGIGFVFGSLGLCFGVGFVCLWVGKYVIMPFNSREGVDFSITDFKLSHGF